MAKGDSLGDRMKASYEDRTRIKLPRRTYVLFRIDGKAFHTFTRKFEKPFDQKLIQMMDQTAVELCKQIMGAQFAYVQSDEISILATDFADISTEAWFDNNLQKMVSVSASIATAKFNQVFQGLIDDATLRNQVALFDSRVWHLTDPFEVENYFIWRQQDWTRNSVQMVARSLYSHKELHGVGVNEMQEKIFQKGINWNDYDPKLKRGRMIVKDESGWKVEAPPVLTQDRAYLRAKIPTIVGGNLLDLTKIYEEAVVV